MLFISFNIPDKLIQPIEEPIHFTSCITEGAITCRTRKIPAHSWLKEKFVRRIWFYIGDGMTSELF